jgi:hypothetical protein
MIVEVCEPGTEMQSVHQIDDVALYLGRHQVDVDVKAYLHTETSAAEELLRLPPTRRPISSWPGPMATAASASGCSAASLGTCSRRGRCAVLFSH